MQDDETCFISAFQYLDVMMKSYLRSGLSSLSLSLSLSLSECVCDSLDTGEIWRALCAHIKIRMSRLYVGSGVNPGKISCSVWYLVGDQFDRRHHNDLLSADFKEVKSYSVKYLTICITRRPLQSRTMCRSLTWGNTMVSYIPVDPFLYYTQQYIV